jgi:predicted GNAT family acetyltransferase
VRIESGGVADYERLSVWHYLAGPPATVDIILRAVHPGPRGEPEVAGVLVVSHPTLHGWWRDVAWPGRYTYRAGGPSRELAASRLNAEVRTISRVIVDPRFRALGVASTLVRAYLSSPRTRRTEAVAAMGGLCPFFERAGMTAHTAAPDERSRAVRAWLNARGIVAADLIEAGRAECVLRRRGVEAFLRAWCAAGVATRRAAELPPAGMAAAVAARAWGTRRAFTWDEHKGVETPRGNCGGEESQSEGRGNARRGRTGRHRATRR